MKANFLAGRLFTELTDLNYEALRWCNNQNNIYHRAVDCVPAQKHAELCIQRASVLEETIELSYYLCPERKISFDGFINYEGRRFGVPYWYLQKTCRVKREGYVLYIYDVSMTKVLRFLEYIVKKINDGLHGFLGDDSGELVAHVNRKEYRQLWNDYTEGKITGTELTNILYKQK